MVNKLLKCVELKVGQLVWLGYQRRFDFRGKARIEAVGIDWAIARSDDGRPWQLEDDDVEPYENQDIEGQ